MASVLSNERSVPASPSTISNENHMQTLMNQINQLATLWKQALPKQEFSKQFVLLLSNLSQLLELHTTPQQKDFNFSTLENILLMAIMGSDPSLSSLFPPNFGPTGNTTTEKIQADVNIIRRSICRCVSALYSKQTQLLYSFNGKLNKALNTLANLKLQNSQISHITCMLYVTGSLYSASSTFMPAMNTLYPLFTKLWKLNMDKFKIAILKVLKNQAKSDKSFLKEDWGEVLKFLKLGVAEKTTPVRLYAGKCVLAIANRMTPEQGNSKFFDPTFQLCVKAMDDSESNVRNIFGKATSQLLFGVKQSLSDEKLAAQKKKTSASTKVYTFSSCLILLTSPFAKTGASKALRESISVAVIHFFKLCSASTLHSNIDIIISHLIGLLSNTKVYVTVHDLQQAMFYVGNMIRKGIIYSLDESGRMVALAEILKIFERFLSNEYALVCLLREVAVLVKLLGEMVIGQRDKLLDACLVCLKHSSEYVRYVACLLIRSVAESLPDQSMYLIGALLNMVQMDLAELAIPSQGSEDHYLKFGNALHGHSNALAALISASALNNLSVSYLLSNATLDTAVLLNKSIHTGTTQSKYVAMRRQEACWILTGSILTLNNTWLKLQMSKVVQLWESVMGAQSRIKLDVEEPSLSYQLRERATQILSLSLFLKQQQQYSSNLLSMTVNNETIVNALVRYIDNTVKLISSLPASYKPSTSTSIQSMNLLKMYLFEVIRMLPESILTNTQYKPVINFITKMAFAEGDGNVTNVETSLLDDDVLNSVSHQTSEDVNQTLFQDNVKSLLDGNEIDTVGYFETRDFLEEYALEADSHYVFLDSREFFVKKPAALTTRVVNSAIQLIGKLFMIHKLNSRKQIVEHLVNQLKIILAKTDDLRGSEIVFSNVIANIYYILKHLIPKAKQLEAEDKKLLSNVHAMLNSSLGHRSGRIRRAAAECMALLANLIKDALIEDLIKRCAARIVIEGPIKAGYALALGNVNRELGVLTGQDYLPSTVSFLQTLAKDPSPETQLSALQSLYYTIEATGAIFSSHIESTIQLFHFIIFTTQKTNYYSDKHLLIGCARILSAMMALGPELIANQNFVALFRFFIYDFLSSKLESIRMEGVLLIQNAAILSPSLLFSLKRFILPKLREFLISETTGDNLRCVSVGTVKVIAETRPNLIAELFPLDLLFQILNRVNQQDESNKSHYEQVIHLLLKSNLYAPKLWVHIITTIVKSTAVAVVVENSEESKESIGGAEDDDAVLNQKEKETTVSVLYSWQSKVFAMQCLRELLTQQQQQKQQIEDSLLYQLNDIISVCSIAASRGTTSVVVQGLYTLKEVIEQFGLVKDLHVANETILQQHAAKFSASISQGFASNASPILLTAAAELTSSFITFKLVGNEKSAIQRICNYLLMHLPKLTQMHFSQYGEVASVMVKVAIVEALAEAFISAHETNHTDLLEVLQDAIKTYLISFWNSCISDYALLVVSKMDTHLLIGQSQQQEQVLQRIGNSVKPQFFEEGLEADVYSYFERAFPAIVNALTRVSVVQKEESKVWKIDVEKMTSPNLVVCLLIRALFQQSNWRNRAVVALVDALTRIIKTETFYQASYAPNITFELFLLLIKMQDDRDLLIQRSCLSLISTIIKSCDAAFFSRISSQHSLESVISAMIETCLKPIRLFFPSLLEQDSEQLLSEKYVIPVEQMNLISICMKCLKNVVKRLEDAIPSSVIYTLMYTVCRVVQYTKQSSALKVVIALTKLKQGDKQLIKKNSNDWNDAYQGAIDNIRSRIAKNIITSSTEIELLFLCLFAIQTNTSNESSLNAIQTQVISTFNSAFLDPSTLTNSAKFANVGYLLQGIQDGVLKMAKIGQSALAVHYLGKLCPSIIVLLTEIAKEKVDFTADNKSKSISPEEVREQTELQIATIAPIGFNILLAAFSLLSQSAAKKVFLAVTIPLFAIMIRFCSKSSTKHLSKLNSLCIQCLERFASVAASEFAEQLLKLPPQVVAEIQEAVKRKTSAPKLQTAAQAKQSLNINFSSYV